MISNVVERLDEGSILWAAGRPLVVGEARPHGRRWLVRFKGCTGREHTEQLRGQVLFGEPIDDPESLWVHRMIGSQVIDVAGVDRGTVVEVVANPAADLLLVESGHLVPLTFVVAHKDNVITVDVPDGIFD